jgi:hypothetical protein
MIEWSINAEKLLIPTGLNSKEFNPGNIKTINKLININTYEESLHDQIKIKTANI